MNHIPVVAPHRERPIAPGAVLSLYAHEHWWPERTEAQVAEVLHAAPAVGAWSAAGDLVGFVRAVTDGVLRAYVEDMIVLPELRGQGLGRRLVAKLLDDVAPVPVVTAFCSTRSAPYYESIGFGRTRQVVLHRRADRGAPRA